MGTLVGHVAPGFGFFVIGLWHLLNHIRLHALHPKAYTSLPWFPTPRIKYLELFLIMGGCLGSISMELFIGPARHQPLDLDGTIPSNHLHNFEHSNISLTFLVYAVFSVLLDKTAAPAKFQLTQFLGAMAFAQQLLLFHLHSADHMGVEGQYHWLLQAVIFVSLATTLLSIPFPRSFLTGFVRSASILLQGVWFMAMGFMLWTPELIPKGCFINSEEGHQVVRCHAHGDLERAKSLVNIQFSWYVIAVTIFAVAAYLALLKIYDQKVEYQSLATKLDDQDDETTIEIEDVEAQKRDDKAARNGESKRFLEMGKFFASSDMER
ncbi:PREDICTED: transmembrane protein 45A-like [Ipomoea nil]|uniref:transmembrane protein 45A-like n=1 Tax=Ipomoea nil TaxID=35883 RepID=UPI000901F29B|nr:PREDICTED: transmembrane protein 45A-like [Ipomoea nil]